ncbi:MAG: ABC transporter ATP-binding protein [Pseudomonadota bacterium]
MSAPQLTVRDLSVQFGDGEDAMRAVKGVSFSLAPGEIVGLVGESGSGKSVTSLALLGLLPRRDCTVGGSIRFGDQEIVGASEQALRPLRGGEIAMIFQEPMTALNPVFSIGSQLRTVIRRHRGMRGRAATALAEQVLRQTGIPEPGARLKQYPHELSGGMRQRVLIAMALACQPRFLIADEPTTALDVTTQAQVLEQLRSLQQKNDLGLLLITHDLGVVAQLCDRVLVMYAGHLVESQGVEALFAQPQHPYTAALMAATPRLDQPALTTGDPAPAGGDLPQTGCPFAPRCARAQARCREATPSPTPLADGGSVACFFPLTQESPA